MRRDIKKSFWVNSEEDRDIKAKSQAAGLTEAEFLRQRVKGYYPVIMPDEVFWKTMESIREFADKIDEVAMNDGGGHEMESFPEWYRTGDPHSKKR